MLTIMLSLEPRHVISNIKRDLVMTNLIVFVFQDYCSNGKERMLLDAVAGNDGGCSASSSNSRGSESSVTTKDGNDISLELTLG